MSNTLKTDLLFVIKSVASEKDINQDILIEIIEQAIQVASKKQYGSSHNIQATMNRKTGDIKLQRFYTVVEKVEDSENELTLEEAKLRNPEAKIGDNIYEDLRPLELSRVEAQITQQVITQKIQEEVRRQQYEAYKDRVGELIVATVKRLDTNSITLELPNKAEAVMHKQDLIPGDMAAGALRRGEQLKSYIKEVRKDNKGLHISLSRTSEDFLRELCRQEIPEIYDGNIEIKSVAREPGSRSKIAVYSRDSSVDPVGSCVGIRGSRVQMIINELRGEKIDIVQWSSDPATFVMSALAPAQVEKIIIDEDKRRIEVIVKSSQLSLAIGRRGQNVRLASQLSGWNIDVIDEDVESKRRVDEFNKLGKLFINALDVDEVLSHLLVAEGFTSVEDISETPVSEFLNMEGFDEELALALKERAQQFLNDNESNYKKDDEIKPAISVSDELTLKELSGMDIELFNVLYDNDIRDIVSFADLSVDELLEIAQKGRIKISNQDAGNLILEARKLVNLT